MQNNPFTVCWHNNQIAEEVGCERASTNGRAAKLLKRPHANREVKENRRERVTHEAGGC